MECVQSNGGCDSSRTRVRKQIVVCVAQVDVTTESRRCGNSVRSREGSLLAPVFKLAAREWATLPSDWLQRVSAIAIWFARAPSIYLADDQLVPAANAILVSTQLRPEPCQSYDPGKGPVSDLTQLLYNQCTHLVALVSTGFQRLADCDTGGCVSNLRVRSQAAAASTDYNNRLHIK